MPTIPDMDGGALSAELERLFTADAANLERIRAREAIRMRVFGDGELVRVGRFEVHGRLGEGGMGIVYAARDPDLDRVIALKLLRVDRGHGLHASNEHLRGEAQALAQLNHPYIVTVYDAGQIGGVLYLAMELVRGPDLRGWLNERRSIAQILAMFGDIAAGVAAAHDAGIVHRDLKPENVLVGSDARPRVVDFGLARVADRLRVSTSDASDGSRRTQAAGTPGYVAAEVIGGAPGDEKSDVYSLCVTLYEALYGRLPDPSRAQPPLQTRHGEGVAEPIRALLLRGLDSRPERRPASMDAVRFSIERGMRMRGRRKAVVVVAVLAALVAGPLVARRAQQGRISAACEREGDAITDSWGEEHRQQVLDVAGTLSPDGNIDGATSVVDQLGAYADEWAAIRIELCRLADVDATLSRRLYARARACLDERAARISAFVELLTSLDHGMKLRGDAVPKVLPPLSPCRDEDELVRSTWPEDPELAATLAGLRRQLMRAPMLRARARNSRGEALTSAIAASAHIHGLRELAADAQIWQGQFLTEQRRYADAERVLTDAFYLASHEQADSITATAAGLLTFVVGTSLRRSEDGLRWGRHAVALSERADVDPQVMAIAHSNIGEVLVLGGRHAEAVAEYETALELLDASAHADVVDVADPLDAIAGAWLRLGRLDEAQADVDSALEIRERAFGPYSILAADAQMTAGEIAAAQGLPIRAIDRFEQALSIGLLAFGPHRVNAELLAHLGLMQLAGGDVQSAVDLVERSLAMFEASVEPESPDKAFALTVMGRIRLELGELDAAEVPLRRALRYCESALGDAHPECATPIELLGRLALLRHEYDVAVALAERALTIREAVFGPRHPALADALVLLGETQLRSGAVDAATTSLERALALRIAAHVHAFLIAEARHRLATALWAEGRDPARALELARAAVAGYRESEHDASRRLAELEPWLATRRSATESITSWSRVSAPGSALRGPDPPSGGDP